MFPAAPVPGWSGRPIEFRCFDEAGGGSLRAPRPGDTTFVVEFDPERDLRPGAADEDPYGFGQLLLQRVHVELRLVVAGVPVSVAETVLTVCDVGRLGALYARILERLVGPGRRPPGRAAG